MHVLVAGGTGFIGTALCQSLVGRGDHVLVLTRDAGRRAPLDGVTLLPWDTSAWQRTLEECDAVVNLAGEPIVGKRWSPRQKLLIRESRLESTRRLVSAMAVLAKRPAVLVNASAVGWYGARGDEPLSEADDPGRGFLAELCRAWEAEAQRAAALGVRVVCLRIGLVLAAGGGVLAKMVPPFRSWLGGPLGSGRQWMSWVHREDLIGLVQWAVAHREVSGAVNATAPNAVTMREFCATLGRIMRRPSWAPVPTAALRVLLGEMADMLVTGQRVVPRQALQQGYAFQYSHLEPALRACLPS